LSKLSKLACGNIPQVAEGDLARSLKHFATTLDLLEGYLRSPRRKRREADRLITPFVIRSIIEVACTSLIARIDPFRVLSLARVQQQATYDPSQKVASALQWQGDVMSDGKSTDLWVSSRKTTDMSRALLGDYQGEIFWQPAFLRLLDYVHENELHELNELAPDLVKTEPSGLTPKFRGVAAKIYSAASKGVHHEFVLSISSYYDDATLDQLVEDTLDFITDMALVANFSETVKYRLTESRALSIYRALQP